MGIYLTQLQEYALIMGMNIKRIRINKKFTVKCLKCQKEFKICAFELREGRGKYCSRQCSPKLKKGHHLNLGKKLSILHRQHLSEARLKSEKVRGKNHWNWRGGYWKMGKGYILILKPDHPGANIRGYVFEHRLIMEQNLGRFLTKNEVVHHINHKKSDNRIENLMLLSSTEHKSLEAKNRWNKKYLTKKQNERINSNISKR